MEIKDEDIERHIKTHSERSEEDRAAVSVLEFFLRCSNISTNFASEDKWPNTDGNFELINDPNISRRPFQNFTVQIKGTDSQYEEINDGIKYSLKSLAFPAYIYKNVTSDPGILFVVIKPKVRTHERVFWKYLSPNFINNIDFKNNSVTITFDKNEEIKCSEESIKEFVKNLTKIAEQHSFIRKLDDTRRNKIEILKIIKERNNDICEAIDRIELLDETRESVSKKMMVSLEDFCMATLLLNAVRCGVENPTIAIAWEKALFDRSTHFLTDFYQSLRYLARRIPEDGQSERLLLKYYDYLWGIREYLKEYYKVEVLTNLEKFPLDLTEEDKDYYEKVCQIVEKNKNQMAGYNKSRYFVEKKTPFYINGKRYYEMTLQLSDLYASKFNRFIVYTHENIPTNYTIQVGFVEDIIELWTKPSRIKVVTSWKVSIDPGVLNKFSSLLNHELKLSGNYGEYSSLMDFLQKTGMNLLDLIDLNEFSFNQAISCIYENKNTQYFKNVLVDIHKNFNNSSNTYGKNIIRYILIRMKEEIIESIKRKPDETKSFYNKSLKITSRCTPFENKPCLYNIPNSKTNNTHFSRDVLRAVGINTVKDYLPYISIKKKVEDSGEIYLNKEDLNEDLLQKIDVYNSKLNSWDIAQGFKVLENDKYVYIQNYESQTLEIINKLKELTISGIGGQKRVNENFIKEHKELFKDDELKKIAVQKLFVDSRLLLIYGAAGTGKTQLMDYISQLMEGKSKLFLTKTHTALQNLKRRISTPGINSKFAVADQIVRGKNIVNYDVIFIDECSTIDNRTMSILLNKINQDALFVMVGDIYQIESIEFGNWFYYVKNIVEGKSMIELNNTWRTENKKIKSLWNEVRILGPQITEKLVIDGPFSERITENLFNDIDSDEDKIVLCLNYDGRYGLNNINNYFQDSNDGHEYKWHEWKYKVKDPILFNESKRFPELYNNLKGKIIGIEQGENYITFKIKAEILLTEFDTRFSDFEVCDYLDDATVIKLTVFENQGGTTEEEREESKLKSIVPFQIAYAVSIHKSQGLEYNNVKIVIPRSNSNKITHGIFYTAITRAKNKLKIYWEAETMDEVIKKIRNDIRENISLEIIKSKLQN